MKLSSRLVFITSLCLSCAGTKVTAQNKSADDSPASIRSVKEIVEFVPKSTWTDLKVPLKKKAALNSANQLLTQKTQRKAATLKVKTTDWQPWKHEVNPDKIHVLVPAQVINAGGTSMRLNMWVTLVDDSEGALAKASKGQELTVTGELILVEVRDTAATGLELHVNLGHGKVERR